LSTLNNLEDKHLCPS